MKDSRKKLLHLLYNHDQKVGGPMTFNPDGNDIGIDSEALDNDIFSLKSQGYIEEHPFALHSVCLSLTEKGTQFVENGFQRPSEVYGTNFNFGNAHINNAIIGNNSSGNELTFNGAAFSELQSLIAAKSSIDQTELQELLAALQRIEDSSEPIPHGFFARFSNLVKKHTDLIAPLGQTLIEILFGI